MLGLDGWFLLFQGFLLLDDRRYTTAGVPRTKSATALTVSGLAWCEVFLFAWSLIYKLTGV